MTQTNDLGTFLKHRRAAVSPADHGISVRGGRRVSGLRREEIAHLAGVSVAYYTRLEQGSSTNASEQVLEALAKVLMLDEPERAHLKDLNGARPAVKLRRPKAESAPEPMLDLLAAMPQVPALLLGRRNDILAWNQLGHQLLGCHLDFDAPLNPATRPSTTRMLFLDSQTRAQEGQWEHYAGTHVAFLRMLSGRYPEDRDLAELIGELMMRSSEFAEFWASTKVRECSFGQRILHHPQAGTIELTYHVLSQPAFPDYRVEFYTTEADSPSRLAINTLSGH